MSSEFPAGPGIGHNNPPERIELVDDVLVLDAIFCQEVLAGATTRTARNLEAEGLPFVLIAGRKYRPLGEGRAWLAGRIQRKGTAPKKRRARR
jgi:hypothetical protein